MHIVASLPAFLLAVVLISASPGPAMALILRRAALHGFRATVPTVLGLELGLYVWALLAGAGLAALVAASATAYLVLRVVGAAVLLYLGAQAWRAAIRDRRTGHSADAGSGDGGSGRPGRERSGSWAFVQGLAVMLANPKAAVFMFAFYPQFVPAGRPLLASTAALAVLQVMLETALYLGLAAAVGRSRAWFSRPAVRRRLNAISGSVLIGLGIRVAATSR
jgi:threonine/homoserine/homoserine lactone efflux protein